MTGLSGAPYPPNGELEYYAAGERRAYTTTADRFFVAAPATRPASKG